MVFDTNVTYWTFSRLSALHRVSLRHDHHHLHSLLELTLKMQVSSTMNTVGIS